MMKDALEKAIHILDENPEGVDVLGPRDEVLIEEAELILGVQIPESYRLFMKRYGVASFFGGEIYGLIDNNPTSSSPDMLWVTQRQRSTSNLPPNFLILCDVGDGSYYVLDASNPPTGGGVYVWVPWNPLPDDKLEKVADSFADFLLERIEFYRSLE